MSKNTTSSTTLSTTTEKKFFTANELFGLVITLYWNVRALCYSVQIGRPSAKTGKIAFGPVEGYIKDVALTDVTMKPTKKGKGDSLSNSVAGRKAAHFNFVGKVDHRINLSNTSVRTLDPYQYANVNGRNDDFIKSLPVVILSTTHKTGDPNIAAMPVIFAPAKEQVEIVYDDADVSDEFADDSDYEASDIYDDEVEPAIQDLPAIVF